jgi:mRNA-degrading endonuclease RelE of RelBE toxin-antitoxin system
MKYSVELTSNFKSEAKKLIKKYPSLKSELIELFLILEENPTTGIPLGNDIYKIRISIASKNKGKSGGARVLTYVKISGNQVVLFSIFNKGETDNITLKQIKELIKLYL